MRIRRLFAWLFLALLPVFIGCGSDSADDDNADETPAATDDDGPAQAEEYQETCEVGPVFSFDLRAKPLVVPYPNDLYRVADETSITGWRIRIDEQTAAPMGRAAGTRLFGFLVDAANDATGFSTLGDLYVPAGEEPLARLLPSNDVPRWRDSVLLFVDDPGSERNGEMMPLAGRVINGAIHVRPRYALRERTHYALVATRGLGPKDGGCYRASASMKEAWAAYKKGEWTDGLAPRYAATLANLESLGVKPERVLSIAEFTTMDTTTDMNEVRQTLEQLAAASPPELSNWKGFPAQGEHLQGYAYLDIKTPIFMDANGLWRRDADGKFAVDHWEPVRALLSLPKPGAAPHGPPYPLVIYGHPITDRKEGLWYFDLAEHFAEQGFAMIAIDSVCHGDRAPDPGGRLAALFCFLNFVGPNNMRDNIRESVANQLWLMHAVKSLADLDVLPAGGDGQPDFITDHNFYFSISLNSIQGGVFAPLATDIPAFVMNVAGGKWTGVAMEGPLLQILVMGAHYLDFLFPGFNMTELVWTLDNLYQTALDPADPANFLPHLTDDPLPGLSDFHPNILQQGGESDFIIGGVSGGYYCRAGGWPQFSPFLWDVGFVAHEPLPAYGSGFYQTDTANHIAVITPGDKIGQAYRTQALHYLRTAQDAGLPEIIDPLNE